MKDTIVQLEKTRDERLQTTFNFMNLDEREEILRKFHPDYKIGTKRAVKVGVNREMIMPNEIVDLLEASPLIKARNVDLSIVDFVTDVLIIGCGIAGASAALGVKSCHVVMAPY